MRKNKVYSLINKYQSGKATDAEKKEIIDWYRTVGNRESQFPEDEHAVDQFMLHRLMTAAQSTEKRHSRTYWLAAASVVAILGTSILLFRNSLVQPGKAGMERAQVIRPGGNKAVLVLADGSEIDLDNKKQQNITSQTGVKILKSAGGQILYTALSQDSKMGRTQPTDTTTLYNIIKTPAGGQFKVVLSDGTTVWLNSLSSLKFPVDFSSKKDRSVVLTGEGYFEVRHDDHKPFRVNSKSQVVEVLGTHFNVNAYPEESSMKTTLLEGAVQIESGNQHVRLNPGQEALLIKDFKVSNVKTAYAVAWKDGLFQFDNERLETIMKVISRWYNIKVVYENESLKRETFGVLSDRVADISTLLNILQQTGDVKFRVDGSTVYVERK
jgi:transmembrane sensor